VKRDAAERTVAGVLKTRVSEVDVDARAFLTKSHAAADPVALLAELGLTLHARPAPLQLPDRKVFGAWDPLLRTIELFGCDESRGDADLVRTLGHELGHAIHQGRLGCSATAEAAAREFAAQWLEHLGPAGMTRCAAALRALAEETSAAGGAAA